MSVAAKQAKRLLAYCRYMVGMGAELSVSKAAIKTLAEMPGPSALSFAFDLFCGQGLVRLHELQLEGKRKYGPVWKASFGRILTVHVADASLIEQVLRQEGEHPMRSDLSSWKDYRQQRGHAYGLLTAEGEEWQELRSVLAKHMLKPKEVKGYSDVLNQVVTDLIASLRDQRSKSNSVVVKDVAGEFYKFGLEGISAVLFDTRIGCLEPKVPKDTEDFIRAINTMFQMTLLTMAMPRFLHKLFPAPWQKFTASWDCMFAFAKRHTDRRMAEIEEKASGGKAIEGKYLTDFLQSQNFSKRAIYGNVTELLLAGVDTISGTMSWTLYELSRHPDVQAALYREITEVVGDKLIPSYADVARMSLMKAVVKETLRLYPVIAGNARVIPDRDIQVGEYIIPQKTLITLCHYATSRDENIFSDPNSFQPLRWLSRHQAAHPFASIPFGVGKRSCVGKRIAEFEVYLAVARILTHFEVRPEFKNKEVKPMTRTLLVPATDINLQFIDR